MKHFFKIICVSLTGISLAFIPSVSLAASKKVRTHGHKLTHKATKSKKKVAHSSSKKSNARSKIKLKKLAHNSRKVESSKGSHRIAKSHKKRGHIVASRRNRHHGRYRSRHRYAQIAPPAPTPQVVKYNGASVASSSASDDLLMNAMSLLGISYRYGGATPMRGLDCSGFIQYVYRETLNVHLPRTAAAMAQVGTRVAKADLRPGDLIFFSHRNNRKRIGHVGMYIGDGKFIHSPRTGQDIEIQSLNKRYYQTHFVMARRIAGGLSSGGSRFVN